VLETRPQTTLGKHSDLCVGNDIHASEQESQNNGAIRNQQVHSKHRLINNYNNYRHITHAILLNRINIDNLHIPESISLANSEFYRSTKVDLFLSAEVFFDFMCIGRIKGLRTQPTWQKALFGWIASGSLVTGNPKHQEVVCNLAINDQLKSSLIRFWQIEHDKRQDTRSHEQRVCEEHFARTYKHNEQGCFVVSLPTKENQLQRIDDSRETALQRFNSLEKRFRRQPQLKDEYSRFIYEYLDLKHMREIQQVI